MKPLRAIAHERDGLFEAQLLELDIAVSARSFDDLVREIEHSLIMEYRIARSRKKTPFVNIVNMTPPAFAAKWDPFRMPRQCQLNLPAEVLDALAIAIHSTESPAFVLQEYRSAA